MKKIYQKPSIKIHYVESEEILAGSGNGISVGGNTGIGIGEGTPPTYGSAKGHSAFDLDNDDTPSPGIDWGD